ncbi:hypothetical protein KY284_019784 [Solanum tuberosum]|nr:hypothetical protein KY284_019784 [Solanum tuberosum]
MVEHRCPLNTNIFSSLTTGLCREGRLEEALRLLDHMQSCGISPGENIYTSMVNCCCKLKMYEDATRFLDTMLTQGFLPHLESYKLLVCGLYDDGNNEKAKTTFFRLLGCGYNNDEVAWKLLIDGLLKRGLVDRCLELLDIMEKNRFRLSAHTYSLLLEGLDRTDNK